MARTHARNGRKAAHSTPHRPGKAAQRPGPQRRRKRSDAEIRAELERHLRLVNEREERRLMRAYKEAGGTDDTILQLITHYQALKTGLKHQRLAGLRPDFLAEVEDKLTELSGTLAHAIRKSGIVDEARL